MRYSVCRPLQQPNSSASLIHFPSRSDGKGSSSPVPGSIIHQKTHITFFFSIQLPSPAASLALFIVSGILHPRSPSSKIYASTASITQRSKTDFSGLFCLWDRHSLPSHLHFIVIPTVLLIRSDLLTTRSPSSFRGDGWGYYSLGMRTDGGAGKNEPASEGEF